MTPRRSVNELWNGNLGQSDSRSHQLDRRLEFLEILSHIDAGFVSDIPILALLDASHLWSRPLRTLPIRGWHLSRRRFPQPHFNA
jgi:hypothetical protein